MLNIYDLKTEYRDNPLGIDEQAPRFSWKLKSSLNDTVQKSYHILIRSEKEIVWDTGLVESEQSIHLPYQGKAFCPTTTYDIELRVTDNHGEVAHRTGCFETGLLSYNNFTGDWITHSFEDNLEPCAIFLKEFSASNEVKKARLYASALGIYEVELNGEKVGDEYFAPGWTSYEHRLQYQTYDITSLVKDQNELAITVGNGWYKGILGFHGQGNHFGDRTAVIGQIEIIYMDGTKVVFGTDDTWTTTTGKHRYNDIYNGEIIDCSLIPPNPVAVQLYDYRKDILVAQESEPVRITERLAARELIITPKGEVVIDFGQNIAGIVEAKINFPKGTKVTIKHAETLDENGNFYTENLRTAKAADVFICSGTEDIFLPSFTFHGFRYIQVEGIGENIDIKNFTACVLHSDLEQTGSFETSNDDVNQLWENINWTLRGNFLDVPTDCPQRDERLAYTGDAQIFSSTAALNKNVALFFGKWLRDIKAEQTPEFGIPMAVPNILGNSGAIAVWHDAATVIPWNMWKMYGDKRFLEEQYESIRGCVEYTRSKTEDNGLLKSGQQLGDWVALDMEKGPMKPLPEGMMNPGVDEKTGSTDVYYVANAYYAYSTWILTQAAEIIGKTEDVEEYTQLYNEIIKNFRNEYVTPSGRLVSETQTGCSLALRFNLIEEKDRHTVLEALLRSLRKHKNHLTTGFVGTQFLCGVLSDNGQHEIAGNVFLQEDCPSWLYSVKLGATTVWELWDGVNPDGSFNKYEMNSLNQYAFASIGDWMYRQLGGLDLLEAGYKKSRIAPQPIKGIPFLNTAIETVHGRLSCQLECKNNRFIIDIEVPENTTAVIALPEREEITVGSGKHHFDYATESSYEEEKYTQQNTLGELLENPIGLHIFNEYAYELLENAMFMQFAKERPILEIVSVTPPEMIQLFNTIIKQLNENERNLA